MRNIYGVEPGETFWAASDIGWVVGHSYIVYAPLFNGNTTVLYEGKPVGTPDPGAFWRVARRARGARAVHRADGAARDQARGSRRRAHAALRPLRGLRALFLAGERTRSRHAALGARRARRSGDRSLVADRDRLGDHGGSAAASRSCPVVDGAAGQAGAGLRRARRSTRPDARSPPARSARSP